MTAVVTAFFSVSALAQATVALEPMLDTTEVRIRFRVSESDVDENYELNDKSLDSLRKLIEAVSSNGSFKFTEIKLESAASPEGPLKFNLDLSRRRAESVIAALKAIDPSLDDDMFVIESRGEDWDGALQFLKESDIPFKDEAIDIMTNVPMKIIKDGKWVDGRKKQMMDLRGGRVWKYMISEYFSKLRKTDIVISFKAPRKEFEQIAALNPIFSGYTIESPRSNFSISAAPKDVYDYYTFALKTNLLYDAVTVLNASIEFPIGKNFSLEFSDIFPWWAWGKNQNKFAIQLWTMGPEFRWWFARTDKRDVLSGHFAGLNVRSGKYDFQKDTDLCYRGTFWTAGVTYGFSLPISEYFNMEFSATVGYLNASYQHYEPGQNYEHLFIDRYKAGRLSYFGPTDVRVSLVWPIDIKYRRHKGTK